MKEHGLPKKVIKLKIKRTRPIGRLQLEPYTTVTSWEGVIEEQMREDRDR